MPNTFDAEEFVHTCREAARDSTPTVEVQEVVRRACSEPSALAAALGHTMGPDGGILHYCDELTVQHLVFPPLSAELSVTVGVEAKVGQGTREDH